MRISDWSSDVCSSDLFNAPFSNTRSVAELVLGEAILLLRRIPEKNARVHQGHWDKTAEGAFEARGKTLGIIGYGNIGSQVGTLAETAGMRRSEEHTSELQSLMRISYAVFSLKKKNRPHIQHTTKKHQK